MTTRGSWVVTAAVFVLACVQFVIVVDETTIVLLGPAVAEDFGLGDAARQVLVTPFAAAFVCGLPLTGVLLRSVDPRRALVLATPVFALCAAAGALANSVAQLVAARAAQGFVAAVVATCVLAALHVTTRRDPRRVRAFALFSLISGSGAVAALVILAPMAAVSWRWCFWTIATAALVCTFGWVAVGWRDVRRPTPRGSLVESPSAVSTVGSATRVETLWSFAAVIGANAALATSVITVSFALQQDHGWTATTTGWGFLPSNAAAGVGTIVVARMTSRIGTGRMLSAGIAAVAVGCAGVAIVGTGPELLIAATIAVGIGIGIVFPLVNHGTLATADFRPVGRAALLGAAQQTGLAAGALVAAAHSDVAMIGLAAVLLGAIPLAWLSSRSPRGAVRA